MDDGGVALAASLSNGTNQPPVEKIAVERFDGSGQGMWGRTLSGTSAPELLSATSDGGMVLMTMASDGFLVRFDATGAPLWTKHVYPSTDLDPSPDGGVRVAGASGGYVLQADENGEIQACSASQDAGVTIEAASPGSTPKTIVVTPGTAIPDILVVQLASAPPPSRTDDCSCRMPLYSGTLTVEKVANVPRVAWSSGGSMRYDVVMGRLSVLEATGGNFTAALDAVAGGACLAQDTTLLQITDGSLVPAPGDGAFYLVRGVEPNCLLGGSFDDPVLPGQVAGRDVAIRASSGSCP
jgi:hypothetical protein